MIVRKCAGGIVFHRNKVFILKNDKGHWVLPKGKIRNGSLAVETALNHVRIEGGVEGEVISTAGETSYEFYSLSRKQPVYNFITWYIMESHSEGFEFNKDLGFLDGGFFPIEEAMDKITHNQDKSLVNLSYKKYLDMINMEDIEEVYV
ncbi:NUDIX domain-containing protein [Anaerosalibacter massiliensis]|uniref:NUDIX hydrolase n=1 Tax=Anaerosalibacter massiliensis TaxID=1347392 RepID=A0A9X2MG52_9FIRM|nr:NUDIX hydrolase [Anaerosalibacter massiliensis]MCR2042956.1 NUDIX hydrolase [Anaerosalibacter massiliensis]